MNPAEWRPILSTLVLPPTGPLLLIACGWLLARRRRAAGRTLGLAGLVLLWLLCCNAVAIRLSDALLPAVAALPPAQAAGLPSRGVQAVVVLGGGLYPQVPELDGPQPSSYTGARALYGAWLARESGLPLGFAGGIGWANAGAAGQPDEADAVARLLARTGLAPLRWADSSSRDTIENARNMAALLQRDGVERIALVTSAWHMPRAVRAFESAGLVVLPAPMGFAVPYQRPVLEWLPSAHGLANAHNVLREWLALRLGR
ncbi:YdcF family protein [Pseudorhodoferax sp.]|uniref:YdcF family protein n=1 Tax=Pseudorhodoferax sp. TaxID=1993553 RepID=UPI002DD63CDD|nr:YdcF family protein [Pseudorhodoferax sp.]